jgi:hypothetical protein
MVSRLVVGPSARPVVLNRPANPQTLIMPRAESIRQSKPVRPGSLREPSFAGGLHNLRQLQEAFRNRASVMGLALLSIRDAKQFLNELGFKRHGENFFGPKGMQVHIDRGVAHNHGDHLDVTQKGQKIKVPVDPTVRFE